MTDLRIADAPELTAAEINDSLKVPTGGYGNYSITMITIRDWLLNYKMFATQSYVDGKVGVVTTALNNHTSRIDNPHQVTKAQVGLSNVDNTSDINKPVSAATQTALTNLNTSLTAAISVKANSADVDTQLALKANKADVYTKSETYTKRESDDLVNNSISTALTPVNTSLDLAKRGIVNRYDSLLTYNSGERVILVNDDIVKSTVDGNRNNPNVNMTGWVKTNSASQIIDESGLSQQGVNNNLYQSINVFTNRTRGFVSLFEFIPSALHSKLKDFSTSKEQVGDVSVYIQQALDYAASNRVDVLAPFAFYFINNTVNVPPRVRFVGLSQPYILGLDTFVDEALLSTDQAGQFEFYIDNFYLNGIAGKNLVGLHIGGCRNSTFKQLQITACFKASVWVHPTHPDSGDVENIELDHIWSVRGAGLLFQTNSGISRGNITDGTITNCQLTSGDTNVKDGFPLSLIASSDRYIFGLKFDRIFTKTTDETHILINPNGGMIYGNEFSFFTGESWVMGSGAPSLAFNQSTMYVLDGTFQKNKFTNFYMTGLQGNGISLGNGSIDNTFDGLICNDFSPTYDNKWIEFRFGADRNICNNVNIDYGLKIEDGAPCANNIFGKKIINLGQSNIVSGGKITTTPPTLVKRDRIFQNNGIQLTNYPVEGCGFSTVNGNLSVSIPAGATPYYLQIPFDTTATFRGDRVAAMLNYQFNASANGLILAMHLGDTGKQITDYTVGKDGVMVFTSPLVSDRKKLVISFLGNRAADVTFIIKDIVIVQGNQIPYLYGYNKLYIEN